MYKCKCPSIYFCGRIIVVKKRKHKSAQKVVFLILKGSPFRSSLNKRFQSTNQRPSEKRETPVTESLLCKYFTCRRRLVSPLAFFLVCLSYQQSGADVSTMPILAIAIQKLALTRRVLQSEWF